MLNGFSRSIVCLTLALVNVAALPGCVSGPFGSPAEPRAEEDTPPDSVESDRRALIALYNATDGRNWSTNDNWLSDKPLGEWHGVVTDDLGRVTELRLQNNRWNGTMPPELGQLSKLKRLLLNRGSLHDLFDSKPLTGEIPAELGNLSDLEELDLGNNELSGAIPSELGRLSNLKFLFLSGSALSGEIPAELGNLSNLQELDLRYNDLSGEIPAELGQLTNLQVLELDGNDLSGGIPAELGQLSTPMFLHSIYNDSRGEITPELAQLTNLLLLSINANSYHEMFGELPGGLDQPSYLEVIVELQFHRPSGEVPSELVGQLSYQEVLGLWDNVLSVRTPAALGRQLSNVLLPIRSGRELRGEASAELDRLATLLTTSLESLKLAGNDLSGCVPSALRDVEKNDFDELGLPFCAPGP